MTPRRQEEKVAAEKAERIALQSDRMVGLIVDVMYVYIKMREVRSATCLVATIFSTVNAKQSCQD